MNVKRMRKLADVVETSESYYQGCWIHKGNNDNMCGTPACIASHAASLSLTKTESLMRVGPNSIIVEDGDCIESVDRRAARWLGVSSDWLGNNSLFIGLPTSSYSNWPVDLSEKWSITQDIVDDDKRRAHQAKLAATYLRRLADEEDKRVKALSDED